jgi:catechol 2,3-dioxygenase-like lactoylglutathione lyase family enzyme
VGDLLSKFPALGRKELQLFQIESIDHVALNVRDLKRAEAWYREVLGLERRFEAEWGDVPTVLCAGSTCVALFPGSGRSHGGNARSQPRVLRHIAFRVDRENFGKAQEELRARGVEFTFEDHEISHSLYFSDPDGHIIELTTYEVD